MIVLSDFIKVIKFFKTALNSRDIILKTRDTETRKGKTQKSKTEFFKIAGRKYRPISIRTEQNIATRK